MTYIEFTIIAVRRHQPVTLRYRKAKSRLRELRRGGQRTTGALHRENPVRGRGNGFSLWLWLSCGKPKGLPARYGRSLHKQSFRISVKNLFKEFFTEAPTLEIAVKILHFLKRNKL